MWVEFSYLQDKSEYTPGNVILDPESGAGQIVERLCELEESSGLVERLVNHPEHYNASLGALVLVFSVDKMLHLMGQINTII